MERGKTLLIGAAASLLGHAAALAALVNAMGAPPPAAPQAAIAVRLVLEPAAAAGPASIAMVPPPEPAASVGPPELASAAPAAEAAAPNAPPAPPAAIKKSGRHLRSPRPDTAVATAPLQQASREEPPVTAPPAPPPEEIGKAAARPADGMAASDGAAAATVATAAATAPPAADYLAKVMTWLERHKEYPDEARSRHDEGTVLIAFVIDRSGQVLSLDIREHSGSPVLDRAAEDMLRRASPLPAPPSSYPEPLLRLVLPLTFALR